MVHDPNSKTWLPARFTHGGIRGLGNGPFGSAAIKQHAIIILNNPLENKDLLFDVCVEGTRHV